jgi:mediator of RNA polymerase II transcription subunit 13
MTTSAVADSTADLGPDATLVDVSDETWALVLQHRLHNTHSLVAHCPALASGLLVRRGGPLHDERPVSLAVSILYYAPSPAVAPGPGPDPGPGFTQQQQQRKQQQQQHLRDVLAMYRGLAVVAQFKRVIVVAPAGEGGDECAMRNVVPWHLAAAIRAQEALSSLM